MDELCRSVVTQNPNMWVPWFLMCSILYYREDKSVIKDETFDWICRQGLSHWDITTHRHKNLITHEDLVAGTGFALRWMKIPLVIYGGAWALYDQSERKHRAKP